MTTSERFSEYLENAQISIRTAANSLGYSHSVVSQYRAGKYTGNLIELEKKIEQWLMREAQRQGTLIVPEMPVTVTRMISTACDIAHANRGISVVCGPAGSGKTTALVQYSTSNSNVYLIEVDQSFSLTVLAKAVCTAIGASDQGVCQDLTARIQQQLHDIDALLIFDEVDYLTPRSLEWIRRVIHDKCRCGVVLSGLPRLEYELKNSKNIHDQLVSRVSYIHRVQSPGPKDLHKVLSSIWNLPQSLSEKIIAASKKSFRTLKNIMGLAALIAKRQNKSVPVWEHFEEAIEGVMA